MKDIHDFFVVEKTLINQKNQKHFFEKIKYLTEHFQNKKCKKFIKKYKKKVNV